MSRSCQNNIYFQDSGFSQKKTLCPRVHTLSCRGNFGPEIACCLEFPHIQESAAARFWYSHFAIDFNRLVLEDNIFVLFFKTCFWKLGSWFVHFWDFSVHRDCHGTVPDPNVQANMIKFYLLYSGPTYGYAAIMSTVTKHFSVEKLRGSSKCAC